MTADIKAYNHLTACEVFELAKKERARTVAIESFNKADLKKIIQELLGKVGLVAIETQSPFPVLEPLSIALVIVPGSNEDQRQAYAKSQLPYVQARILQCQELIQGKAQ